jgi:membrane-associated phospholipid phosphatase
MNSCQEVGLKEKLTVKTLFVRTFQSRLTLFLTLLAVQGLFFVTNRLNSLLRAPDDGWELKIGFIDNHLSPAGIWLIPYAVGFFFAVLIPLWAADHMPIKLYRQFILSMIFAASISYVIYMLLPTYVIKPRVETIAGNDVFSDMLRQAYSLDNAYSTHNAAPSQHVFYAILNMCFMIRFRPRQRVFWFWVILAALITASALLTRQHHSPDLIAGYAMAIVAYRVGLFLGERVTIWLGDEDDPAVAPVRRLKIRRRTAGVVVDSW